MNASLRRGKSEAEASRNAWVAVRQQYRRTEGGKWVHKAASAKSLYVKRNVENAAEIIKYFKEQGFETTLQPADLHVTVMYSKTAVEWPEPDDDRLIIQSARNRIVTPLGDGGAVVQKFSSSTLTRRWSELCEYGCSWDWPEYQPHITITWNAGDIDLSKIEPYVDEIVLGPEIFEELDEDWKDKVTEKNFNFFKFDKKLGLVFGWAIVSKIGGQEYYDVQGDHIPEESMLEATTDFMLKRRTMKLMHKGEQRGEVVFAWPLTEEIAKAMGIKSQVTGLMIAVKPTSKKLIEAAEQGVLQGFSIGGSRIVDEEVG